MTINLKSKTNNEPKMIFIVNDTRCNVNYTTDVVNENVFQPIDLSTKLSKGYVYSAYYDDRQSKQVIVVSILESSSNIDCILWFSKQVSMIVQGNIYMIPEGSGRRYTASYIYCPFKSSKIPKYVSIIRQPCHSIDNLVKIKPIDKNKQLKRQFSDCVTPLNLKYNNVNQLIEMLSINELMGVSHFYFYNYSSGNDADIIFRDYVKRGIITIQPWHLPMKVHIWPIPPGYEEEVKYFGQMAALNDCLLRNMGHYKYVAFVDLDEYLIPRQHRNWEELFREIIDRKYGSSKAWIFRNIFFKTEWPSDEEMAKNQTIASLKAMSLLKVRRESTIYDAFQRSKMIVDPLAIDVVGVHNIWKFQPGGRESVLNSDEGLCHHYRFWDGMGQKEFVIDKNIFRLREDLVGIIQKNRKKFF